MLKTPVKAVAPTTTKSTMAEVRAGVDALDRELIELFARRFSYMRAAARIKPDRSMVRDEARKAQVIAQAKAAAFELGVPVGLIGDFWDRLVEASIAYEGEHWELLRRCIGGYERSAHRLDHFREFQPAHFCGVLLVARLFDRPGQRGEFRGIAGVKIGVGQGRLVARDRCLDRLDPLGQRVIIALVLVAELRTLRFRRGRGRSSGGGSGCLGRA